MSNDQSNMMTGMPSGAASKGSADSKTTAAKRSELRNASVRARCDLYGADSDEKASGGAYTHVSGEDRLESAQTTYLRSSSDANNQIIMGQPWVSQKFNDAGMMQQLKVLTHGQQAEHTQRVETEIKAALLSMDLSHPDNQEYLKDKFGELGMNMGDDEGTGVLFTAINSFLSDKPSFEQQVTAKAPLAPVLRLN